MMKDKITILSSHKLLCASGKFFLYCKGSALYKQKSNGGSEEYIGSVPGKFIFRLFSKSHILCRLFRLEPRCGIFVDENTALISIHGGIYGVDLEKDGIYREHSFRKGMNNPLRFSKIENIKGFENCIVYGEYFGNLTKEEVCIYSRSKEGVWKRIDTFAPNTVMHIHGIVPFPEMNCLFVLTGDEDKESGIWKIENNFQSIKPVVTGKQIYRSCVAFPYEKGIVYGTDTPLEKNAIYYIPDINSTKLSLIKLADLPGPCIYGMQLSNGDFAFGTSVEPDSRKKGISYKLTYKLGIGVQDRFSHIIMGNPEKGFREVFKAKKDWFPMLLFQFGNFLFPQMETDRLIVTGQSVSKLDGMTIEIYYE